MDDFILELKNRTDGEVHFDEIHRRIYSVDASIFEIKPVAIFIPKTIEDLVLAVEIATKSQVPVIPRGAATGITGGCLGNALIIDLSKYLTQILEINLQEEYVIVQPGVVQDTLNQALSSFGYRLGPDTSTGNRATIGGMVANNSAGARSLYYGKMVDQVLEIELLLSSSKRIHFKALDWLEYEQKLLLNDEEGDIYRKIDQILTTYKDPIAHGFPKIPRRVSGYNLDLLTFDPKFNMCKLITGSEGTLGIATKIKLKITKKPKFLSMTLIHFNSIEQAMKSVPKLLESHPIALEMLDEIIIQTGLKSLKNSEALNLLIGNPKTLFIAEFQGDSLQEVEKKCHDFEKKLEELKIGYAYLSILDSSKMEAIWNIRKSGLGLLLSKKSYSRAIAFIEDLSVHPNELSDFMKKFQAYMKKIGKDAGIYGHVGSGCMHIRPYVDLRSPDELQLMKKIMLDVTDLVLEHGGALSGEHGDGIIRSWLTEKCFGKVLTQSFIEVKKAFDPNFMMNPHKIVFSQPLLENLRMDPETKIPKISTFLDFTKEGGFNLAIDLCNGNGNCRKKEGLMCPSFQASSDEYDSTRARAQSLRAIVNGKVPTKDLSSQEIYDVLDLCLECKGCKTECPSEIDMAKIKSEVLYQYQEKHGYFFRNQLFGNISRINQFTYPFRKIFNYLIKKKFFKTLLNYVGISHQRTLPKLAEEKFSNHFKNFQQTIKDDLKKGSVLLFNDTYTEFHHPEIGISAVKILNYLGFKVILIPWNCCGRPLISKGLLKEAKKKALKLHDILNDLIDRDLPIIGLEPSCLLTLKDDFGSLIQKNVDKIKALATTFDEFIHHQLKNHQIHLKAKADTEIYLHTHCHQKALVGSKPTLELLKQIENVRVKEIDSGCCGMAGSFGYEKEHYSFSMKIGSLKLFKAIETISPKSYLLANGFSCRTQIEDGTKRSSKHLAVLLDEILDFDEKT